jgi:hypothetical protein
MVKRTKISLRVSLRTRIAGKWTEKTMPSDEYTLMNVNIQMVEERRCDWKLLPEGRNFFPMASGRILDIDENGQKTRPSGFVSSGIVLAIWEVPHLWWVRSEVVD